MRCQIPLNPRSVDVAPDVYSVLTAEWDAVTSGPKARQTIHRWANRCPTLGGFDTPSELIATIGRLGEPDRSCALLAELLVLAAIDTIAARAVLQAVLPGLRQAAKRHWSPAARGTWASPDELDVDTVSMGWEAIHAHGGERHHRPAKIIVRDVEARLRQARERGEDKTRSPSRSRACQRRRHNPGQTRHSARNAKEPR